MNRKMLLDHLALVERHVREGERHLLRQREIIAELERHAPWSVEDIGAAFAVRDHAAGSRFGETVTAQ